MKCRPDTIVTVQDSARGGASRSNVVALRLKAHSTARDADAASQRVRATARTFAAVLPAPPHSSVAQFDPFMPEAWRNLVMTAADRLIDLAGGRVAVLLEAAGPFPEVGVNPPWRKLVEIAIEVLVRPEYAVTACAPSALTKVG